MIIEPRVCTEIVVLAYTVTLSDEEGAESAVDSEYATVQAVGYA